MKKISLRYRLPDIRYCLMLSALLCCSFLVLTAAACRPAGPGEETEADTSAGTEEPETDSVVTIPEEETADGTEPGTEFFTIEPETAPDDPHPGDSSAYEGLLISMVYGTGKNNADAAISHGFIQLYNETEHEIPLAGASLYYKTEGAGAYNRLAFPADAAVKPHGYYLIRANSPAGYQTAAAVMTVDRFDAEWDVFIDNKEVRLVLAPSGWQLSPDEDILKLKGAVSVFLASESYNNSVFAVDSLSKNKIAVRTALKGYSGYHTEDVTTMTYNDLDALCPKTSSGVMCSAVNGRLNEVRFSFPAGVYDEPILLNLYAAEGYTIWYTTDGTDPSKGLSTRKEYTRSILLSETDAMRWGNTTKEWSKYHGGATPKAVTMPGAYVVRAYAENGTDTTAVFTNTYFIDPFMASQGLTVISFSIPVREMIGSNGFYSNYILPGHGITDPRPRGLATMEVFDPNGQRVGHSNVELAVSGNGSSGWAMKSLRIYYKKSNNLDGGMEKDLDYDLFDGRAVNAQGEVITNFSRLLLRNSGNDCGNSYIRDAYMQSTALGLDVDHMASASTLVFFNGEFWGIYNIRERYSQDYVSSHYGILKDNVALIESDYSQVHTNAEAPYVVSSGLPDDADPFNEMVAFIRSHSLSDPANYEYVCGLMDIDSFIDSYVVRIFYSSDDWPNNNIKVWRNRDPNDPSGMDTKWHFTLLDLDMGIGWSDRQNYNAEGNNFFYKLGGGSVCADIMVYLMANRDFKNQFICRFYEVVKNYLTTERMTEILDRFVIERDDLMYLQTARWGNEFAGINTWNSAVSVMRRFCEKRQDIVLNQLYAQFGVSETDILNMSRRQITVAFDGGRADVTFDGVLQEAGEVHDITESPFTFTIHAKAKEGYVVKAIVWSPLSGLVKRIDAEEGADELSQTITTEVSGTVTVICRAVNSDPTAGEGGTLVAGPTYLFYLDNNGDLYGWGDNRFGVLGLDPAQAYVTVPTLVMRNVAKVATTCSTTYEGGETNFTTAIVTKDGKLYTVGVNNFGQLGRNGTTNDPVLRQVTIGRRIADVAVGNDHTVVVDANGYMLGVGHNNYGQLGTGTAETVTEWVQVDTGVVSVSAGRRCTTLIKKDGHLYGLGDNRWEKLVDGSPDRLSKPTLMMQNAAFTSSGQHQCVVVTKNGALYYAGWRPFSSFTQGSGNNPTMVKVMDGVKQAFVQSDNMIILCESGDVYGYGLNTGNALCKAMTGGKPQLITSDSVSAAAGYNFSAYLYRDGTICVQGTNDYGQAGAGTVGGTVSMAEVMR